MWTQLVSTALVALSAASVVEASGHAHPFMKRMQQNDRARSQQYARQAAAASSPSVDSTSGFRFLNNNTQKYRVKSLPDVNYNIGEMYSGNVPIHVNDSSRSLFFVFQPKLGDPVDEVTIWLNGGPGCSSLDGFFQENGRFLWQSGVYEPVENPYSWVNLTNMLWVDQPVGVGFTTGVSHATNEVDTAREFGDFFKNFQDAFGIKRFKIYVTGESYAGRYVPYISAEFLNRKDKTYFDLHGSLVYDPVIGAFTYTQEEVPIVPQVLANNNLYGLNSTYLAQLEALHESCGYKHLLDTYLQFPPPGNQPAAPQQVTGSCDVFSSVIDAALEVNPCWNLYAINQQCPLLWDVLGFPTLLSFEYPGQTIYFNRSDVKAAMHAPPGVDWSICKSDPYHAASGGPEGYGDTSPDPIQHVLPQVIEATNRVLVGNGDYDAVIITNGTLLAIQNMTWNGKLGFQQRPSTPIDIQLPDLQYQEVFNENGLNGVDGPQGVTGIQHYERGLMWVQTFQSGHMQPEDQPRTSYRHLQWLLGRIDVI